MIRSFPSAGRTSIAIFVSLWAGLSGYLSAQPYEIHPLGINASTHDMTIDLAGKMHIIYVQNHKLYYAQIVDLRIKNSTFLATLTGSETWFTRPRISVRNDGKTVHVVYGDAKLTHVWKDGKGKWRTETVRSPVANRRYFGPVCAVTDDESVHVLYQYWNGSSSASPMIYLRKPSGKNWSSDKSLSSNSKAEYRDPSVFVDSYGGLHVSWRAPVVSPSCFYRYAPAGGSLENARTYTIPYAKGITHNGFGDLQVDENGRVHRPIATWSSQKKITIDYSYRDEGGNFRSPTRPSIGELAGIGYHWPAVTSDRFGRIYVSYLDEVKNKSALYLSVLERGVWTKYLVDPATQNGYNGFIKPTLDSTRSNVYGIYRNSSGKLILGVLRLDDSASRLTITGPNSTGTFARGEVKTIRWTSNNLAGPVNIYLYQNHRLVGTIAEDIPVGNGTYDWKTGTLIEGSASNGMGYKIRIQSRDGQYWDASDGAFQIQPPPPPVYR